jgi:hypothetical protein
MLLQNAASFYKFQTLQVPSKLTVHIDYNDAFVRIETKRHFLHFVMTLILESLSYLPVKGFWK